MTGSIPTILSTSFRHLEKTAHYHTTQVPGFFKWHHYNTSQLPSKCTWSFIFYVYTILDFLNPPPPLMYIILPYRAGIGEDSILFNSSLYFKNDEEWEELKLDITMTRCLNDKLMNYFSGAHSFQIKCQNWWDPNQFQSKAVTNQVFWWKKNNKYLFFISSVNLFM